MTPTDTIGPDITLFNADCLAVLPELAPGSVDAVVTDPPYGLEFMGKEWDRLWRTDQTGPSRREGAMAGQTRWLGNGSPSPRYAAGPAAQQWHHEWASAVLNVLKPGGYALIFGGTRTYHRLACAVEDAGFEIRDCLMWIYGSGFPKGKGCLKPAYEPILLCRKPGQKVLELGIDECRVGTEVETWPASRSYGTKAKKFNTYSEQDSETQETGPAPPGRWPANVLHDGSEEVLEAFAEFGNRDVCARSANRGAIGYDSAGAGQYDPTGVRGYGTPGKVDRGTAARFFYTAKASRKERGEGNDHPTVKPLALMRWLVNLVSKPGDTIIDPFLGSGSTIEAARGRHCIGIERDEGYYATALRRLRHAAGKADDQLFSVLEAGA